MLYPFYGSYTKILIIFGSAHDLIHKIQHNSKTAEKEKENATVPLRPRSSAQLAWNLAQPAFPRARWQFCRKALGFLSNQPADQATIHMSLRLCNQTPPSSRLYNSKVPDAPGRPERDIPRRRGLRRPTPATPNQTEASTSTSKQPATERARKPELYCSSELWPRAAADMAAAVLTPVALDW